MFIKVDHRDILVKAVASSELDDCRGIFYGETGEILIDQTIPAAEQAETLIHELLHAIWCSRHMKSRLGEEAAVSQLASGLATVIRDNPVLPMLLSNALISGMPLFP
jgi:hypothetical protein